MFRLGFPALLVCVGLLFAGLMFYETRPMTGRVVDATGNPVFHAEVQLEKLFGEEIFHESWRWLENGFEPVFTGEDGTFLIPFPREQGAFRLAVSHNDFADAAREVDLGEKDIEVVMPNAWTVVGELQWDVDVFGKTLELHILPEDGNAPYWSRSFQNCVSPGKPFQFEGVSAGKSEVYLGVNGPEEAPFLIELDLNENGGTYDLGAVDLRNKFRKVSISTQNDVGETLILARGSSPDGFHINRSYEGVIDMVFQGESLDLEIFAENHRPLSLTYVSHDQTVTLQRGYSVELLFEPLDWFPEDVEVWTSVVWDEEGSPAKSIFSGQLFHGSPWDYIEKPGRYRVLIELLDFSRIDESDELHHPAPLTYVTTIENAPIITVMDLDELQSIPVHLDEQVIRDAVKRLRYLDWPKD